MLLRTAFVLSIALYLLILLVPIFPLSSHPRVESKTYIPLGIPKFGQPTRILIFVRHYFPHIALINLPLLGCSMPWCRVHDIPITADSSVASHNWLIFVEKTLGVEFSKTWSNKFNILSYC